jgi:hypothetical protein
MTQSRTPAAKRDPTGPNQTTIKRLFAHSGNRCAFPRCTVLLVQDKTVVGEICHIKAASPSGPRYDPQQTIVQRHSYDNLLLLCANHHATIDDDPEAYTVERLIKMKSDHEAKMKTDHQTRSVLTRGASRLLDKSVTSVNQSGGITAHTVQQTITIHSPSSSPDRRLERQSIVTRARIFHRNRVAQITAAAAPITLMGFGTLVLHLVPFSSIDEQSAGAFGEISRNPDWFPPIATDYARDSHIDHSGLLIGSNARGLREPQRAYVKVFRSASVESVASSLGRGQPREFIILPQIQDMITRYTYRYAASLARCGVQPPIIVLASLGNVKDMRLLQTFIENAILVDLPFRLLSEQAELDPAILDTVPIELAECEQMLTPLITHLANTAGLSSPPPTGRRS